MVSEVANSKYHSLFFILQSKDSVPFRFKWFYFHSTFSPFRAHSSLERGGGGGGTMLPQTPALTTCIQFFFSCLKRVNLKRKNKRISTSSAAVTDGISKWLLYIYTMRRILLAVCLVFMKKDMNAYLLLNFWGCFSLIVWNRWAIEASCRKAKQQLLKK